MSATKNAPVKVAPALAPIVTRLAAQGPQQSAADLATDSIRMGRLVKAGIVKRVESADVRTGGRGRPAHRYSLTDRGRRAARNIAKAAATQEA